MAGERDIEQIQDHVLAERAQQGRRPAFDELYRRHASATWRLAQAVTRDPAAAGAAVAAAFAATLAGRGGSGLAPDQNLRLALLTATRHAATDPTRLPAPRSATGFDLGAKGGTVVLARSAFAELPERWRSALWLVDVEGCPVDDAAVVLEVSPAVAAPLVERARLGLQEQVLQSGLTAASPADCRRTTDRLTAYAAATLAPADATRVRRHLDRCEACRERLAVLDDLVPMLRASAAALPVLLVDEAVARWSAATIRDAGPLHLVLPGGRPVPAWAQRAAAGAVAAVVALGIAGATVLSGGRGRSADDQTRPTTAQAPLGESALGEPGLSDLILDGYGFVPPAAGAGQGGDGAGAAAPATATGAPLPRTTAPGAPSIGDPLVVQPLPRSTPPSATPPPSTTPPGSSTPPPSSGSQLTVNVGGVASVTVGETCTGAQVAGTVIGCEPPATEEPVVIGGTSAPTGGTTAPLSTVTSPLTTSLGL